MARCGRYGAGPMTELDVLAVGNAIVDVLTRVDDAALAANDLAKGSMQLVDLDRAEAIYGAMGPAVESSGGGAANTAVGVASLGGTSGFIGRVRDDQLGQVFTHDIRAVGVRFETPPATTGEATGRCLVMVTPDAERTMSTYLGAAAELHPDDIDPEVIGSAAFTFLEGYLWDPMGARDAVRAAAAAARSAGQQVAFTLCDAFLIERHRADFRAFLGNSVDVAFANEAELLALYETDDFDTACEQLADAVPLAAVTLGERGSVVVRGTDRHAVPARAVAELIDTTGAGDAYAAGFLYGLARGLPLPRCAEIGSLAASEVISHMGPRPEIRLATLLD